MSGESCADEAELARAAVPEKYKLGKCYEQAGRHVWDNPDTHTLAHAEVTGQGPIEGMRYGHAFTIFQDPESGQEMVYDPSIDLTMPAVQYYRIGQINPDEIKRFSIAEMNEKLAEIGHWGAWERNRAAARTAAIRRAGAARSAARRRAGPSTTRQFNNRTYVLQQIEYATKAEAQAGAAAHRAVRWGRSGHADRPGPRPPGPLSGPGSWHRTWRGRNARVVQTAGRWWVYTAPSRRRS